jgi:hypothetical protein
LGIIKYINIFDNIDVFDDINEENILCEFVKFTKTKKLQKKIKEQISDHPDVDWSLQNKHSRNVRGIKRSRGVNEYIESDESGEEEMKSYGNNEEED